MTLDRRQFLTTMVAATVLPRRVGASPHFDRGFARSTAIADGVFATMSNEKKGLQCYSNGGVLAGRDGVLIIEGHFQAEGARFEIDIARSVTKAPIRGVVDTHWHLDHSFGNVGYAQANIPILAHEQVGPLMKESYVRVGASDRSARLATRDKRLAEATDPIDRAHKAGDLKQVTWMIDAVNEATLAFPTEPIAPADFPKRLDLGGLTAILEFHPGHSRTDVLIRVPERDVVFTGDLFFNHVVPVNADTDILAWRRVLDMLAGYDPATRFIPGHGPIGRVEDVRQQAALMDDMRGHAERMLHKGANADDAARRYVLPHAFRNFDILCWDFTVGGAMRNYFAALK